jgi:phosphoglycolate phosphatase-like HAD superfamily hydrolase
MDIKDGIEAILFDLDGTLMDTDDQAVEKLARQLERLRFPRPHQVARRIIMASETPGNLMMTVVDLLGMDAPLMAFTNRLRRWRGLHTEPDFRIIAGVEEMLARLGDRYRLGVVSTRGRAEAEAFLKQHQLHNTFEIVVTRESTWRLKPHPAPIQHAARLLGVPAERCAMVGDTTVDMRSARRAGAWAVAVLCGFGEREELERAGAHVVLEQTADLGASQETTKGPEPA